MKDIVIATGNYGKINDFKAIFTHDNVIGINELLTDFDVEETGTTFEENAALKAVAASEILNKTVISDDSGLAVDALDGAPGIYSARYAEYGNDEANMDLLLSNMSRIKDRRAKFVCVIAVKKPGEDVRTYRGEVEGTIGYEKLGTNGFGYDPIFRLKDGRSMAELTNEEKANISHRKRAINKMLEGEQ